jgi:hypothetical protein
MFFAEKPSFFNVFQKTLADMTKKTENAKCNIGTKPKELNAYREGSRVFLRSGQIYKIGMKYHFLVPAFTSSVINRVKRSGRCRKM